MNNSNSSDSSELVNSDATTTTATNNKIYRGQKRPFTSTTASFTSKQSELINTATEHIFNLNQPQTSQLFPIRTTTKQKADDSDRSFHQLSKRPMIRTADEDDQEECIIEEDDDSNSYFQQNQSKIDSENENSSSSIEIISNYDAKSALQTSPSSYTNNSQSSTRVQYGDTTQSSLSSCKADTNISETNYSDENNNNNIYDEQEIFTTNRDDFVEEIEDEEQLFNITTTNDSNKTTASNSQTIKTGSNTSSLLNNTDDDNQLLLTDDDDQTDTVERNQTKIKSENTFVPHNSGTSNHRNFNNGRSYVNKYSDNNFTRSFNNNISKFNKGNQYGNHNQYSNYNNHYNNNRNNNNNNTSHFRINSNRNSNYQYNSSQNSHNNNKQYNRFNNKTSPSSPINLACTSKTATSSRNRSTYSPPTMSTITSFNENNTEFNNNRIGSGVGNVIPVSSSSSSSSLSPSAGFNNKRRASFNNQHKSHNYRNEPSTDLNTTEGTFSSTFNAAITGSNIRHSADVIIFYRYESFC